MRWLACSLAMTLTAACGGTAHEEGAGAADAGRDASAAADAGARDAGPSCGAVLSERRVACGELTCADGPCPDECADVLFSEEEDGWIECHGSEHVEDACGAGCLSRVGGPRLCGGPRDADCGPVAYCDGSCGDSGWSAGTCRPRPTRCDPEVARIACVCGGVLQRDECEAHRAGTTTSFCNLFEHGPCESRLPFPEVGCEETMTAWLFNGYACVAGQACPDEPSVFFDESECRSAFADCRYGPAGSLRACSDSSVCESNELCLFPPEDPCGRGGSAGRCQVGTRGCYRVGVPNVCGCDGVTYHSSCDALLVGRTAVDHAGACGGVQ